VSERNETVVAVATIAAVVVLLVMLLRHCDREADRVESCIQRGGSPSACCLAFEPAGLCAQDDKP